ncbi:hypothetical protein CANINC_004391 [Pichia inconspicua]|uniref:Purine nucleoside permease n=1 Tax=Pichia inconspicua TaxID=52247 RepID=A0A4V4NF74_9ASCO|nr:hypothetical protein CANINC_004391 [[Candida] inconspicua]
MLFRQLGAFLLVTCVSSALTFPHSDELYKPEYTSTIQPSTSASYSAPAIQTSGLNETMYTEYRDYSPKVFIVNMFSLEQAPFLERYNFTHKLTIPGLSPLYNTIHCDENYELCEVTTGEGEINAASTLTALSLSPLFDLSRTFFLVAGIAGISPLKGTIGDVTFARFAIQILEYEVDARELPSNWTTGYFDYGTDEPNVYPGNIYGTEIFELNTNLRDRALELAESVFLYNGTEINEETRLSYNYSPANTTPKAIACDTLTGDTYYFGELLDQTFDNYTTLLTNGTGNYCTSQQEDNATLEALIRAAAFGLVDFSRIVLMRTASDFTYDDNFSGNKTIEFFTEYDQGGITDSIVNLVYASDPFIRDVIENFEDYDNGLYAPSNYIGDYFNTLQRNLTTREWGVESWGTA